MKTIGNILWFIFGGFETAIMWFFLGIVWCLTIIGIPFGKQCFKLARLSIWPMGTQVNTNFAAHPFANVLWFLLGGFSLAIAYVFLGLVWCITIIGIPFGKQAFKLAGLSVFPFGATIGDGTAAEGSN